ncbi:hypothetical protein BGX31_003029, partial [Mortierella sp. GBA43]
SKLFQESDFDKVVLVDGLPERHRSRAQAIFNAEDDLATFIDKVRAIGRDITTSDLLGLPNSRGVVGRQHPKTSQRRYRGGGYHPNLESTGPRPPALYLHQELDQMRKEMTRKKKFIRRSDSLA